MQVYEHYLLPGTFEQHARFVRLTKHLRYDLFTRTLECSTYEYTSPHTVWFGVAPGHSLYHKIPKSCDTDELLQFLHAVQHFDP